MACGGGSDNTVVHTSPVAKTEVVVEYYLPEGSDGSGITIK
jgi:hypothetical protein